MDNNLREKVEGILDRYDVWLKIQNAINSFVEYKATDGLVDELVALMESREKDAVMGFAEWFELNNHVGNMDYAINGKTIRAWVEEYLTHKSGEGDKTKTPTRQSGEVIKDIISPSSDNDRLEREFRERFIEHNGKEFAGMNTLIWDWILTHAREIGSLT